MLSNMQYALKTTSKIVIQKSADATGDLIGNASKKSLARSQNDDANNENKAPKKKIHISRIKAANY